MAESLAKDDKEKRDKERSREKDKARDKERESKDRDIRDRDKDRESKDRERNHKSRGKDVERDDRSKHEKDKEHRDRNKDKDKENKDRKGDRDHRDKERERERDRPRDKEREKEQDRDKEKTRDKGRDNGTEEGEFNAGGAAEMSMSVEETNALRAKLGIAPLKIDTGPSTEELEKQQAEREALEKEMKTIELADKLDKLKNKRLLTAKMAGKSIAEEVTEEDDDPLAWIEKSRKLEAEKVVALQRARMMDELDEEQEEIAEKRPMYSEKNLSGMKITHNVEQFGENEEILVLKDSYIVGEDGLNEDEDELESVHISEAARRKKNVDAAKKKPLYDVYGDTGEKQELLPQYNDEKKDTGITLGAGGEVDLIKKQQLDEVRKKLQAVKQEAYNLEAPAHLKPMADYYTTEEMTHFKKPERKRKKKPSRKKENLAEIIAATSSQGGSANDHGSRATRTEGTVEQKMKHEKETRSQNYEKALARASEESKVLYSADVDDDEDFYSTLAQARKAPAIESVAAAVAAAALRRKTEEEDASPTPMIEYDDDEEGEGKTRGPLVISATSEFVRNIHIEPDEKPAVKTEGITSTLKTIKEEKPKPSVDEEMEDLEKDEKDKSDEEEEEDDANPLVANEPLVSGSLAATLQFLKQRGSSMPFEAYSGRTNDKVVSAKGDDPAPNLSYLLKWLFLNIIDFWYIRLEYLDEQGRPMTTKEAFRHQSYKFHGKKPGKNNQEKRQKRLEMDKKKLAASATDTPLGAVAALQSAQQKTKSAYVVLQAGSMSLAARADGGVASTAGSEQGTKRKGQTTAGSDKRTKR